MTFDLTLYILWGRWQSGQVEALGDRAKVNEGDTFNTTTDSAGYSS